MRPTEFLRLALREDDPLRVEFEASSIRIHGGPGVYRDPFCPDCKIERTEMTVHITSSQGGCMTGTRSERKIRCMKHFDEFRI